MLKFAEQNARFIAPIPWLLLSAMKFWNAVETGQFVLYFESFAFVLLALLFYFIQLKLHRQRQAKTL